MIPRMTQRHTLQVLATSLVLVFLTYAEAEEVVVNILPVPAFPPAAKFDGPSTAFVEVSSSPNKITDRDAWFTRHSLSQPRRSAGEDVAEMDAVLEQLTGIKGVFDVEPVNATWLLSGGDTRILVSGGLHDAEYSCLSGFDAATSRLRYALDFGQYAVPPGEGVDPEMDAQEPVWAVETDGVLYVAHSHRGYAVVSAGKNGYITALDVSTMTVLWRSASLVANARTFVVHDDYLVTGYGFTDESDYLYLLRRKDGSVAGRIKLKTAPEYILKKDGLLYVRCYDTDAVFRVIAPD